MANAWKSHSSNDTPDGTTPPQTSRHQGRATVAGLTAILLWSTTFALARSLTEALGPMTSAAAVYLVAAAILMPCSIRLYLRSSSRPVLRPGYLVGCGMLFAAYTVLLYVAVGLCHDRQQLLEVALINYLWPVLTVLLSVPVLKKRASTALIPATLIAVTGLFMVLTQGTTFSLQTFAANLGGNPLAYLAAGLAALCWAFYSVLTRRWAPLQERGAVGPFILFTACCLLPIALNSGESPQWNPRALMEIAAQGIITALAYALWDHAMRLGNLPLVTSCSYLTPLLSTAASCIYLGILPSSKLWVGTALLVTGSFLSWTSTRRRLQPRKP